MPDFKIIEPFVRDGSYRVNSDWKYLEEMLNNWKERCTSSGGLADDGLDLDPDFQRGHVWTEAQQIAFVEFALRGGRSARELYFNNPSWQGRYTAKTVLVDGKQRLTAARAFMAGNIPAFGHRITEWTGRIPSECYFVVNMNTLQTRKEVLEWYLQINASGTPHTPEELARVRELIRIEEEKLK